ncbi:MAG: thiolase family protein [Deltaproteobacteria bacterium]|uniref:Thiolase family protein n=1 Tax=Candidatus Zymogenus saltonus TaxID=2844893 RepID=A0A9D8KFK2_9DELT|nr:thiolase family protein [Candidatus Zymogenus saltonus]
MEDVYIIGVGMIRFGKYLDRTIKGMAKDAVDLVFMDAGVKKEDIEAAYVANTFWGMFNGQHSIRGQVILRSMGIQGLPITNVENACAGASTALNLACHGVSCGTYDVALALGVEKITNENKALSFQAYATCLDVEGFNEHIQFLLNVGKSLNLDTPEESGAPGEGRSIFMDIYSIGARWHMATYGSTQRQLATISAKNHFHSSLNPLSQYQKDMNVEEVLNDRLISYPLTRAMCAPVGDGAAAAIVCSKKYLKRLAGARPVKVRASVLGSGTDRPIDGIDIGERLSKKAYEVSGIGPGDIDIAEVHDATAYGELHQTEAMGFCPEGEGGVFAESGATKLGGKIPINTSGGLESRGHPIGASGLAQIHEIVTQLRGEAGKRQAEGARIGLTENGGGNIGVEEAAMCVHVLEKV